MEAVALLQAAPLLLVATALLLLAGLAKAAVDIMSHQPDNNIFMDWGPFFDNRTSWQRKYAAYPADLRPRFPGAKTWAVAATDFWHLCDFLYLRCHLLAGIVAGGALAQAGAPAAAYGAFALWAAFILGAVFEITYRRYFRINPTVSV